MGGKRLDLNAPLLSVRRISTPRASSDRLSSKETANSPPKRQHSLPLDTSDWDLGEVTKPAAVPFHWEQTPGRPKYNSGPLPQLHSNTPRLPPGRVKSSEQKVVRSQIAASPSNDHGMLLDSLMKDINHKGDSDLENGGEVYADALDTLSPIDSFSYSYSVSGLSGYDDVNVKPSGTFSSDSQTRDFLMSRFLPAAKAAILETPLYFPRKQRLVTEEHRQVRRVVSGELRPLLEQYMSTTVSPYGKYIEDTESEDADEYDGPGRSLKACGLFPWIGMKNSMCLLNQVPGVKPRTLTPKPSSREVNRLARTSFSGPLTRTFDKNAWNATQKKQFHTGTGSQELRRVESKLTETSKKFSYSGDLQMMEQLSPYRRSKSGVISPYRNERPQSPFQHGARFLGTPKENENGKVNKLSWYAKVHNEFQVVSSRRTFKQGLGSVQPVAEKMVYIDSSSCLQTPVSNSVDKKEEADRFLGSPGENLKTMVESKKEEFFTPNSSIQDIKCLYLLEGENTPKPEAIFSLDADLSSFASLSNLKGQSDRKEVVVTVDSRLDQQNSKIEFCGNLVKSNEDIIEQDHQRNPDVGPLQSPLPPPLPKSPSESWLWKTLPSISLRSPFAHSHIGKHFHNKKQDPKTSTADTKWETMVKSSNLHHDHVRYSEELIPHIPRHSKT